MKQRVRSARRPPNFLLISEVHKSRNSPPSSHVSSSTHANPVLTGFHFQDDDDNGSVDLRIAIELQRRRANGEDYSDGDMLKGDTTASLRQVMRAASCDYRSPTIRFDSRTPINDQKLFTFFFLFFSCATKSTVPNICVPLRPRQIHIQSTPIS